MKPFKKFLLATLLIGSTASVVAQEVPTYLQAQKPLNKALTKATDFKALAYLHALGDDQTPVVLLAILKSLVNEEEALKTIETELQQLIEGQQKTNTLLEAMASLQLTH